jgi:hypothetical protein
MNPPDFPEFQQLLLVKEIKLVEQQENEKQVNEP